MNIATQSPCSTFASNTDFVLRLSHAHHRVVRGVLLACSQLLIVRSSLKVKHQHSSSAVLHRTIRNPPAEGVTKILSLKTKKQQHQPLVAKVKKTFDNAVRIPKRLEVEAASGKGFIFHTFSVWNSGASCGDITQFSNVT